MLLLFNWDQFFEKKKKKKEFKSLLFSKKLTTNLFWLNNGGISGVFLLFKKHFKRDQSGLEFLWRLFGLFAIRS